MLDKSINWLEKNFMRYVDGNYPLESLYKLPLAFALLDKREKSLDIINLLKLRYCCDDFHFYDDYNNKRNCDIYYDFWILLYYIYVNDSDSIKLYSTLLKSYNAKIGAFNSRLHFSNKEYLEIRATAFGAICAYFMKDYTTLLQTSDFLVCKYYENINKYNKEKFYYLYDSKGKYIDDYNGGKVSLYFKGQKDILYYAFYLSSLSLALAYCYSKDIKYLHTSVDYLNYFNLNDDDVKINSYSGKLCVCCSVLYNLTKNKKYSKYLKDILENFEKSQNEDGYWKFNDSDCFKSEIKSIDRTSEFSICIKCTDYTEKF